ncbi:bacillithiol system redox-active protein YtxJ [Peribacillus tepidiphilus]|jgi:bacillithiol system protein YtxJ|uniref:bacillithiol system redox-active protein YtxJ n=1 Tax=Peribacillus tepidiphilus TaxID=2652445 RepID=UPI001291B47C|nr:bacillithiol system redox-active protein YtxJ [Peribacillus tepidiphilus]
MTIQKIETEEQFEELLKRSSFFLLKHSLTCPVSGAAFEEYQKFAEENPDLDTVYLAVQEARPLSNYIAEKFHVKHESPQAILFKNGDVAWHTSHWKITKKSLNQAISEE